MFEKDYWLLFLALQFLHRYVPFTMYNVQGTMYSVDGTRMLHSNDATMCDAHENQTPFQSQTNAGIYIVYMDVCTHYAYFTILRRFYTPPFLHGLRKGRK